MTKRLTIWYVGLLAALFGVASGLTAQPRLHIHSGMAGGTWDFPLTLDSLSETTVSDDLDALLLHVTGEATVPFSISAIDSLTIEAEPAVETKDHYKVFQLYVTTNDGHDVTSKEVYRDCFFMLGAQGSFSNFSAGAGIRGRGNSSFHWYDKKPYRLKLHKKHKMLGLSKAKSWVLLANYRDVTDMMNTFVFETGQWLGLPFTNHTRYVELFLNGDYRGLYQLTEQVQQGSNRVAVGDEGGILLSLDVDDGPAESPYETDNFWSEVYKLPSCVKYPDDEYFTYNTVDSVRAVFAELEHAIKNKEYARVEELLDVPSFIKYLQLQEFVYNVELDAPRSIFLHKDGDGPWVMGPLWDFDAGYDFDWGNMYTGHTYFHDYHETVMGTNPLKRNGQYKPSAFFTDLFACPEFVEAYKAQWAAVKDSIVSHGWTECMRYVDELRASGAIAREEARWPISGKHFDTELEKMHQWLLNRADFMTQLIENIPVPAAPVTDEKLCGTIQLEADIDWYGGYTQYDDISVSRADVMQLMGISDMNEADVNIVPLFTDGTEGPNNTNGLFGGWFNADGDPFDWYQGHVYIEVYSHDLWHWSYGLHQGNCYDDEHTVTMQIQYPHDGTLLKVNVEVHFNID